MQRDLALSAFNSEFAYENKNLRLQATETNTTLSLINERGPKHLSISINGEAKESLDGAVIGQAVVGIYLVLFVTARKSLADNVLENPDSIYRFHFEKNKLIGTLLFNGELQFSMEHPIETLSSYENGKIQKVYWTDGYNQPRVINVTKDLLTGSTPVYSDTSFDFVATLSLEEQVTIERTNSGNGLFAPGVIQYAFSYYDKYGRESNIFYTSGLQYTSFEDRGGSPEDVVSSSFNITIRNIDTSFDYVRIYSIHRTSINATPVCRKVADIEMYNIGNGTVHYTDNGTTGEIIDAAQLMYVGGETIVAGTLEQKDGTLFLGNLKMTRLAVPEEVKQRSRAIIITQRQRTVSITDNVKDTQGYYGYTSQLGKGYTAGFKANEWYRCGYQFQHESGKWSEPIYISDYTLGSIHPSYSGGVLALNALAATVPQTIVDSMLALGYKRVRPLVVYPTIQDRKVIAQGMICPTVFSIEARKANAPFAQSSWFLRPNLPPSVDRNNEANIDLGAWVEFRHNYPLKTGSDRGAEIQNMDFGGSRGKFENGLPSLEAEDLKKYSNAHFVDQSIVTMHSPDIEFDDNTWAFNNSNLKFRIVGLANFTSNSGDIRVKTSSPTFDSDSAGFLHTSTAVVDSPNAGRNLCAGLFYSDRPIDDLKKDKEDIEHKFGIVSKDGKIKTPAFNYMVYPWHRFGSLNNDCTRGGTADSGTRSAMLETKKISNLKYSGYNTWLTSYWGASEGITPIQLFHSNEMEMTKITEIKNTKLNRLSYYGNVDTLSIASGSYEILCKDPSEPSEGITELSWLFRNDEGRAFKEYGGPIGDFVPGLIRSREAVPIKYKSAPHVTFAFNYSSDGNQIVLPTVNNADSVNGKTYTPFWNALRSRGNVPPSTLRWEADCSYNDNDSCTNYEIYGHPYTAYDEVNQKLYRCYFDETHREDVSNIGDFQDYYIYEEITLEEGNQIFVESTGILYVVGNGGNVSEDEEQFKNTISISQDSLEMTEPTNPYLYIGELYRDEEDIANPFGGSTDGDDTNTYALQADMWYPAGESLPLIKGSAVMINYIWGDTWYQRYDFLKTYPFTQEDVNSVIEIGSFMCETRINCDGRYDRNRGQASNLNMNIANFNRMNPVYSQQNNFFNYRMQDADNYKLNDFPNTLTWTLTKPLAAQNDAWTNITLANTLDLDGDKGVLTSIKRYNDALIAFQEAGIAQILYNENVQISSTDGVPIEIANSGKVQGKRYIASSIGCANKWSICESPSALYFLDDVTRHMYRFSGKLENLSLTKGLTSWFNPLLGDSKTWDPLDFDGFVAYYDRENADVMMINEAECLSFSETLDEYTSFYSYNKTPFFANLGTKEIWSRNTEDEDTHAYSFSLWQHQKGEYNMFFDHYEPFYTTIVANSEPLIDKVFNNIEFLSDSWDMHTYAKPMVVHDDTFDAVDVWNEYQVGSHELYTKGNQLGTLSKKFRIWRATLPRAAYSTYGDTRQGNTHEMIVNDIQAEESTATVGVPDTYSKNEDRIRNTWACVKLWKLKPNNYRTVLHSLTVKYTI